MSLYWLTKKCTNRRRDATKHITSSPNNACAWVKVLLIGNYRSYGRSGILFRYLWQCQILVRPSTGALGTTLMNRSSAFMCSWFLCKSAVCVCLWCDRKNAMDSSLVCAARASKDLIGRCSIYILIFFTSRFCSQCLGLYYVGRLSFLILWYLIGLVSKSWAHSWGLCKVWELPQASA